VRVQSDQEGFVERILGIAPALAAFDCDGTLWTIDCGFGFFEWELDKGLVAPDVAAWARGRYEAYLAGTVDEDTICGEMVTMHRGLAAATLEAAAADYFRGHVVQHAFSDMLRLVDRLLERNVQVWLVSASNEWVIRAAAAWLGLPPGRVLATTARTVEGVVTDRLVRVPSGPGKRHALETVVGRAPDVAFGNSRWDAEMLGYARQGFAVNPTPELERLAAENGWSIHQPVWPCP
jgi:phosphoserine phosphatase